MTCSLLLRWQSYFVGVSCVMSVTALFCARDGQDWRWEITYRLLGYWGCRPGVLAPLHINPGKAKITVANETCVWHVGIFRYPSEILILECFIQQHYYRFKNSWKMIKNYFLIKFAHFYFWNNKIWFKTCLINFKNIFNVKFFFKFLSIGNYDIYYFIFL